MQKLVELKIYGRVQGVFFRANARERGRELGLKVQAENMPDGTVKIIAEGRGVALEKFIDWCKQGPALAKVEKIDIFKNHESNHQKNQ